MKTRTLKVYEFFRSHSWLPRILLQGKWLQEAGIKPGDKITITLESGKLIISKVL